MASLESNNSESSIMMIMFRLYGKAIGVTIIVHIVLFLVMFYLITQRKELSRMLCYSEDVEINKLRNSRSDMKHVTREELLSKFNLL